MTVYVPHFIKVKSDRIWEMDYLTYPDDPDDWAYRINANFILYEIENILPQLKQYGNVYHKKILFKGGNQNRICIKFKDDADEAFFLLQAPEMRFEA